MQYEFDEFEPVKFSQLGVGDLVKFVSLRTSKSDYVSYCVIVKLGPSPAQKRMDSSYYNNVMWGFWEESSEKAVGVEAPQKY
jgi:hypothetical protein